MNTIAARVARVHTGSSVATLIHALDDDGLEHKIEVPPALARTVVPGQVLILQWSVHTVPNLASPEPQAPATQAVDPIDHEFDLRNSASAAAVGARDFIDEFNTLLGPTRGRG